MREGYDQAWPESIGRKRLTLEACADSKMRGLLHVLEELGNVEQVSGASQGGPMPTSEKSSEEQAHPAMKLENKTQVGKFRALPRGIRRRTEQRREARRLSADSHVQR